MIALSKPQEKVFFFHDSRLSGWFDCASEKNGLRIPTPERLQHLVPSQEIEGEFRKTELMINVQTRLQFLV